MPMKTMQSFLCMQKPFKIVLIILFFMILLAYFADLNLIGIQLSSFGYNNHFCNYSIYHSNDGKICNYKICSSNHYNKTNIKAMVNNTFLKSHPNLPRFLLSREEFHPLLPQLHRIRWTGVHWQESEKDYPKFLLYSAHFDNYRTIKDFQKSYIYILGLYDGKSRPEKYLCQLYFNDSMPVFALPVLSYVLIDWQGFSSNYLVPYLLTCAVPNPTDQEYLPSAVSLVRAPCEVPTNLLQITGLEEEYRFENLNNTSKKHQPTVGICGPALYYYDEDFSVRLIEWIELLSNIGVTKIILYKTTVHKNIEKVLNYYEKSGLVKIISFHYPPPYLDEPSLRKFWTQSNRQELFALENVYFTDCILRFKDQFNYLGHFDPDEMIILKKHKTIGDLILDLRNQYDAKSLPTSFGLKWKVFYSDIKPGISAKNISEDFYMLRHNRRISKLINKYDDNMKSIYDTSRVRAVYSHQPLLFLGGSSQGKAVIVDPNMAYTAHFRIQSCGQKCVIQNLVEENRLLREKKVIVRKVMQVKIALNFN